MSVLGQVLERLRRAGPPPGAAARALAVPSAGDELSHEVAFLFGELDAAQARGQALLDGAQSEAQAIETAAAEERRALLHDAEREGERVAAELLATRRTECERRAEAIIAAARREADGVLRRGSARTPQLVEAVVDRVLGVQR